MRKLLAIVCAEIAATAALPVSGADEGLTAAAQSVFFVHNNLEPDGEGSCIGEVILGLQPQAIEFTGRIYYSVVNTECTIDAVHEYDLLPEPVPTSAGSKLTVRAKTRHTASSDDNWVVHTARAWGGSNCNTELSGSYHNGHHGDPASFYNYNGCTTTYTHGGWSGGYENGHSNRAYVDSSATTYCAFGGAAPGQCSLVSPQGGGGNGGGSGTGTTVPKGGTSYTVINTM